ncbi:ABC transporter ATP-binding protein/permease [Yinghuangia sp. ASG 101]|uniref:ABC transporter ATP-binding protein n=1 Tax=Yinghuangia sp. ASG 101 TaxID=2896848 RepID=UPI001E29C9D5|nr:ABC transporter ATP-binding protein [Yinghuangia sp. ASG 101]UGQ10092.1 ABC transporter ATP-binding protein/permease [Yinghuangia sp. ASG 101]
MTAVTEPEPGLETPERDTPAGGAVPPPPGPTPDRPDATRPRESGWAVLRRGLALSPEFRQGLGLTLVLAALATAGRIIVPLTVQLTIDNGLRGDDGPDLALVRWMILPAALAVIVTALCSYGMNVRIYNASERGLATLRVRAFRHVHDLSTLHQQSERRGSLVSRVTGDVDTISRFIQQGGVMAVVSVGQLLVVTALMLVYSWQLTLLVWACFTPLFFLLRSFQTRIAAAADAVRVHAGRMLGAISEPVVGASVVRAHAIEDRTAARIDEAIEGHRAAQTRAQKLVALTFPTGEIAVGVGNALVVVVGVLLGVDGQLTLGELVAFLFLVTLFVAPVQFGVEILNEAQNALAGWRRVLEILDAEPDIGDPGPNGADLPRGPVEVRFDGVAYAYPGGPRVLHDVDVTLGARSRVAVVGETGSGKTTFAKLLTRIVDPDEGRVLLDGIPLADVRFASLRARVVMVPQDGFLFDATIRDNVRYGRPDADDAAVSGAFDDLGLADWLAGLPQGLDTPVGQRGESLSAGERQLVALARAYVADPDLLVLDEATSAVDPATEVRIQRALDGLTRGRTAVFIAHRMSTAESADEILVFDAGRLVERGPHRELVARDGTYARLHTSWAAQQKPAVR